MKKKGFTEEELKGKLVKFALFLAYFMLCVDFLYLTQVEFFESEVFQV